MRHQISLDTWELFLTALDSGSLQQCARVFRVDVSTVSRRLKMLEDALGLQLFYRDNAGVFPTTAGQNMLSQIRPILEEIAQLKADLVNDAASFSGRYLVHLPHVLNCPEVQNIFFDCCTNNPRLQFDFLAGDSSDVLMQEPDVEVTCVRGVPAGFDFVGDVEVCSAASYGYLDSKGMPQSPEELPSHDVIMSGAMRYSRRLQFSKGGLLVSMPVEPSSVVRFVHAALREARRDGGIAVGVPRFSAQPLFTSGDLHEVLGEWRMEPLKIAVKASGRMSGSFFYSYLVNYLRMSFSRKGEDEVFGFKGVE